MTEIRFVLVQQQSAPSASAPVIDRDQINDQVQQALSRAQADLDKAKAQHTQHIIVRQGALVPPVPPLGPGEGFTIESGNGVPVIPSGVTDMAYGFFVMCAVMVVGWPIARAFGRRIERKDITAQLPPATTEQLLRIEQAVEAMSIEVERISEAQRFMAKIQSGSTAERV